MSVAAEAPASASGFNPRVVAVLVCVALFAFSAFAVLGAYAPELRSGEDGGQHALSRSAVGFAGAVALLRAQGVPVVVSRAPDMRQGHASLVVLTPTFANTPDDLNRLASRKVTLIVLPKWEAPPDPLRRGWVRKAGLWGDRKMVGRMLGRLAKSSELANRVGAARSRLKLAPGVEVRDPQGRRLDLGVLTPGPIERLQTISGEGWSPILTDETGRIVLAASQAQEQTYVLADPDLLNTQGLANLDTARAGLAILDALRSDGTGVTFDVSLAGYGRSRNVGKLMLEAPILGATLCVVAAALLMGLHGLARFGPARPSGRALALGSLGLVDSSAGLIRLGRKQPELARPYADLVQATTLRAAGGARGEAGDPAERLDRLEHLARPTTPRRELVKATGSVTTPADLLAVARRWRHWKLEMTRDRR